MFGISKDVYQDLTTRQKSEKVYLRLYLSAFKSGLVAKLSGNEFKVLLTVCSYMDEDGMCFPTQEQIMERSGLSKPTVSKAINSLLKFEFNGKPIIERDFVQRGQFKNSVYHVNPISQVAIFGGDVETTDVDIDTGISTGVSTDISTDVSTGVSTVFNVPKEIIAYYLQVFREVYGVQPSMNYGQCTKLIKSKWLGNFTDEQIKTMIETSVKEYDARWKSAKFPRPTLPAIVSWIGEQALGLVTDNDKDYEEAVELTANSEEMNQRALERLKARLQK